jgi:NAD(P)-dependent dehydrogenase (short-subunit alcohol dehydrogenase family)
MSNKEYSPPTKETHFLVSGGGRGITAECVKALAKTFHANFTLIGRSQVLTDEPEWAANNYDEAELKQAALEYFKGQNKKVTPKQIEKEVKQVLSSREINQTLEEINQSGGTGQYIQVDVTDSSDLIAKLKAISGEITGILHGAGALADKYIQDKKEADFDLVYGVKVSGLENILNLIPPANLKYLILFSSVAGFYGNAGQADYSLSNEILNKLSYHLKETYPNCQVLSLGWGPWDGGMVSPQLKRILVRKNVPLISVDEGTKTLVELLKTPQQNPQRVIGNPLPFPPRKLAEELKEHKITRRLLLEDNPFLEDHVIGGKAVLPTVCAVAWFINSSEALYQGYNYYSVRDYRVFKGIVFDEESPEEYQLHVKELQKSPQEIILEAKISSKTSAGKKRNHYQAQVELRKGIPERPKITDFNLISESNIDGSSLYSSKTLFHGPRFRGVQKVLNISPKGITTECNLPGFPSSEMGQFAVSNFNPYLADVHLQSLLIWANFQIDSIGLPLHIAEGIQYQQPPFGETTYTTMRVKENTSHKLMADVINHDQDGYIYTKVTNAEITLNERLFDLFQDNQLEKEPA